MKRKIVYFFLIIILFLGNCQRKQCDTRGQNVNARLLSISTTQSHFKESCIIDKNRNNIGEYAFLQELLGFQTARFTVKKNFFPLNFPKYKMHDRIITCHDYNFCIYLPGKSGAVRKVENFSKEQIEAQEKYWICYAWPNKINGRVFVINQSGKIFYFANSNKRYYGYKKIPEAYAGLSIKGSFKHLNSLLGSPTVDGEKWKELGE